MELILKALKDKYEYQKSAALAELAILLQSPVGIGEHSNIIAECHQKIQSIAESEENLKIVNKLTNENIKKEE